jgi:cytochrome c556
MIGITNPAATAVYEAVGTKSTAAGIEEIAPKTDEEWAKVGSAAAAVVESGNLMLMGSRAIDKGDWVKMTRAMMDQGKAAMKAAEAKDKDKIVEAGGELNATCDTCHARYSRE